MTRKKAVEIMTILQAEYFYAFKDMPENLFEIKIATFMKALNGYTDKEIDIALQTVLKECKTCPTTANFIEVIERNRELLLPSAEEEWAKVTNVLARIKRNREISDIDRRVDDSRKAYNSLPFDVRGYYVNYSGFLDLIEARNIEIEKSKFLKGYPAYLKKQKQKKELSKQLEMKI